MRRFAQWIGFKPQPNDLLVLGWFVFGSGMFAQLLEYILEGTFSLRLIGAYCNIFLITLSGHYLREKRTQIDYRVSGS
jgi:hypothetical protein